MTRLTSLSTGITTAAAAMAVAFAAPSAATDPANGASTESAQRYGPYTPAGG